MAKLELTSNFEMSLENIEQYVKTVLNENDASKKKTLWFHFQKLINMLFLNDDTIKQPRKSDSVESQPKKLRLEPVLNRFPDEMWLRILTYLSARDIFGSFAHVSKHFNNLTIGSTSIKYLHLKNINVSYEREDGLQKIITRSRNLTEFNVERSNIYSSYHSVCFIEEALKTCERLKSIKVIFEIQR